MTKREDAGGTVETEFKEGLGIRLFVRVFRRRLWAEAPGKKVAGVEGDAEEIGGGEIRIGRCGHR